MQLRFRKPSVVLAQCVKIPFLVQKFKLTKTLIKWLIWIFAPKNSKKWVIFIVQKGNFCLKSRFLAWKFKYLILWGRKIPQLLLNFGLNNTNKLTKSILLKSNFWTKICVLTHCVIDGKTPRCREFTGTPRQASIIWKKNMCSILMSL